jgi:tetratricopeptide (TPR) repeat protein/transcriptional regulator with XRE-family HTH domain
MSGYGPNRELRRQRLLRGWSLEDLAAAVLDVGRQTGEGSLALTPKTVGRWERGESCPRAPYPKLLCIVFARSAEELGLDTGPAGATPSWTPRAFDTGSDREAVLGALGRGLAFPLIQTRTGAGGRGMAASGTPGGMDSTSADLIATALGSLRMLQERFGGPAVVGPTLELRSLAERLALHPASPDIQSRLRSVTAEVSLFLGWLAFDAADNSTARGYYHEALRSAREGADADLPRYVLGHIAWLAQAEGKVAEALSVVDSEIDPAPPAPALWTRSWFAAVEANVRAVAGETGACRLALERSHQWFTKASQADLPRWLPTYDRAQLLAFEGRCFERIEELTLARDTWELALTSLRPDRIRERGSYLVHLSRVCTRLGKAEAACQLAQEALSIALETGSVRIRRQISAIRAQLEPWIRTRSVAELDRRLADAG